MSHLAVWIAILATATAVTDGNADVAVGEVPAEAVLADLPFLDSPEPFRVVVDLASPGSSRALRFMVDTGASHTVATPRAANELGIRVRRHKRDPYRRKTVLGRDVQIFVDTRSSDTASKTGWEYALLGGQFLAEYVVEFDFAARRMRLIDPRRFEVPEAIAAPGEAIVPLVIRMNRPGLELMLNDVATLVLLDTGAPPPIIVSGPIAKAAGIPENELPGFQTHGVLGAMQSELRMLDRLSIGGFEFPNVPAIVNPRGWFNQGMPSDSVIGYELLQQFSQIRIDYKRRRMWLKRDPEAVLTFGGKTFETLEDLLQPAADATEPPNEHAPVPVPEAAAPDELEPANL